MNREPAVAIVVPTLNAGRFLAEALDSVAAQTYPPGEVVVVDGGSSDATLEIAGRYRGVRVVRQSSRGLAGAWNEGLEATGGELVAFLDSDDRWRSDKLEVQVAALHSGGADYALSRMRFFLEPGCAPPPGFRSGLLEGDHVGNMPSALLARRSVFERIGRFDTRWAVAADLDWFARLTEARLPVALVDAVLVEKRVHDANLSTLAGASVNRELVELLRERVGRRREDSGVELSERERPDPGHGSE